MRAHHTVRTIAGAAFASLVMLAMTAGAQPQEKPEMPPMPKPGPEHELFKEDAGAWDATVEMYMEPGAPPMVSKGTETNTVGCGGLCLITDFESTMMDQPFHGHGTSTWDAAKKKYVGSWTDSMSVGLMISEGTWDPASRTMTGWMEGPDMSGKTMKMRSTVEYKPDGSRVMNMYQPGPDGKEVLGMRITYKKKS